MKHTAGKWTNVGLEIRHENRSIILANVYTHLEANQSKEETLANAKLIASAPELLEALTFLLSSYKADFETITGAPLNDTEAVKQAINAIKKATE